MLPSRELARPAGDRSRLNKEEGVCVGTATRDAGTRHAASGLAPRAADREL